MFCWILIFLMITFPSSHYVRRYFDRGGDGHCTGQKIMVKIHKLFGLLITWCLCSIHLIGVALSKYNAFDTARNIYQNSHSKKRVPTTIQSLSINKYISESQTLLITSVLYLHSFTLRPWDLTTTLIDKLEACQIWFFMRLGKISWKNKASN